MTKVCDAALRLLARREHGAQELTDKLLQRGYSFEEAQRAVALCQEKGLQSDERFIGSYLRSRIRQGYGPQKIRQELQGKNLDSELIHAVFIEEDPDWFDLALSVWQKKMRFGPELDFNGLQKMKRFLLYRGFSSDIIQQVVSELKTMDRIS